MDDKIVVKPEKIMCLGEARGAEFVLVTNSVHKGKFEISPEALATYTSTRIIYIDESDHFIDALTQEISEPAHILTILTECLLHSVPPDLLGKRKLLIMACRSGKTSMEGIKHFLDCGYATNVHEVQKISDAFFETGGNSSHLLLKDSVTGTVATFDHTSDEYDWHEQCGVLEYGDQQVFPAGEIACFLVPLYTTELPDRRFALSGEMTICGPSIVQSGPPSFLLEDQLRIYESLMTADEDGVYIKIDKGVIVEHKAQSERSKPAADILSSLFNIDSRYRNIYEVGFSINPSIEFWRGNSAMNEVWGQGGGKLHLGLGMLPYTQYHIDAFCKNTVVYDDNGAVIFGRKK